MNFLNQLKIKRLIKESRDIIETLPDGLIIHQEKGNQIDVMYLNSTFNQMFSPKDQIQLNNNDQDYQKLTKIYLRKTQYVIKNKKVEQLTECEIEEPKSMMEEIQNFESGQVYEIVYRDIFTGKFIQSDEVF